MAAQTSALIAIMNNEPERRRINEWIEAATATYVSAASLLETRMVLFARFSDSEVPALDACLLKSGRTVLEDSPHIAEIAFDAYRRYGKGSGHETALNYGDCFSYALARYLAAPLLFKGDDFSKTDLRSAADERREHHRPADP